MKRAILLGTTGIAIAFAMLAAGYLSGNSGRAIAEDATPTSQQAATTSLPRAEVEAIVRDYLLANPEIMLEVQQALEMKQREEQRLASQDAIATDPDDIFNAAYDGVVGNPDGKVTIVEFFDYNCGYCKRAQEDMQALTAADPELRFVLKEFPILGEDSVQAHIVSMAVHKIAPDKFADFHNQLLGSRGRANEAGAIKIATALGVDEAALRETMKDDAIHESFQKTMALADKLQITGTPSYVVGDEVVYGALGRQVLGEKIAAVKAACTSETC